MSVQPEKGPWFVQKTQGVWTVYQSAMNEFHATRELAQQRADELNAAKRVRDAAPQLLAACKAALAEANMMTEEEVDEGVRAEISQATMRKIAAAIAAAEGTG